MIVHHTLGELLDVVARRALESQIAERHLSLPALSRILDEALVVFAGAGYCAGGPRLRILCLIRGLAISLPLLGLRLLGLRRVLTRGRRRPADTDRYRHGSRN